jgi:hypothetical protein
MDKVVMVVRRECNRETGENALMTEFWNNVALNGPALAWNDAYPRIVVDIRRRNPLTGTINYC